MPDWTYQTVFRPLLFQMQPRRGRGLALGAMGRLARFPFGKFVIRFMGHMAPDERLRVEKCGMTFPAPSGLGADFDPKMKATPALGEFGFGFLEIGPIVANSRPAGPVFVDRNKETIELQLPLESLTPSEAADQLQRDGPFSAPIIARLDPADADEARVMVRMLQDHVDAFAIHVDQIELLNDVDVKIPLLVIVRGSQQQSESLQQQLRELCGAGCAGVIVAAAEGVSYQQAETTRRTLGAVGRENGGEIVRSVREGIGPAPLIIGSIGVHTPADALDYFDAGADLVQIDSGLVFSGPGLPKRINEAVLYRSVAAEEHSYEQPAAKRIGAYSWFWALLMGLSMFGGGLLALVIACTRVVLPYDEAMTELTREELMKVNPRLLAFMTHDRVTLAGTMLAVGIQYAVYAWWGVRHGLHWTYISVVASAFAGFFCFFSFLGFGYFDQLHAFVTAVLVQLLLLTLHAELTPRRELTQPDLWNDNRWRRNQWGQLMFVIHGAVLIVAGSVIMKVAMTSVFVPEDLHFMHTSSEALLQHPLLVPLVAHDRATFGGMLIACGVATLLPALWGFRRGQSWLWWALMIGGSIAYLCTILVHWAVGYNSLKHLLPAYGGLAWLWVGAALSYSHLVAPDEKLQAAWEARLASNSGLNSDDRQHNRDANQHGAD